MSSVSISIANKIDRLERDLHALKNRNPWQLEKEINNLLKALNAEPSSERDYLRERLFTIAATAILTTGVMRSLDSSPIAKFFNSEKSQIHTEQVQPALDKGLAKPASPIAKPTAKPAPKPEAKPVAKQGISLERLMKAIATQESNENHTVINGDSGASGKWQVMPSNIPSWSKAALGREVSHSQFMNSPQIQHEIVKHRLGLYLNQQSEPGRSEEEIIRRVASAWYSGQPRLWNNTKPQYSNGRKYPSIAEYTASIWNRYSSVNSVSKFADTKALIATWEKKWQSDPKTGDLIAGYVVSSARGWRKDWKNGKPEYHGGVDLAAPLGTPLYAIADGQVKCFQDAYGGGTVVSFTSNLFPGLEFELLHLSRCTNKRFVKESEVIGYIGSTGNSTGPHLHLQINSLISGNSLRVRSGWLYWFVTGKKP